MRINNNWFPTIYKIITNTTLLVNKWNPSTDGFKKKKKRCLLLLVIQSLQRIIFCIWKYNFSKPQSSTEKCCFLNTIPKSQFS